MANDVSKRFLTASLFSTVVLDSNYTMDIRDSVLICIHSSPITITTLTSTEATVFHLWMIIDASGEAETNNITISAGSGTTVNGESSIVIDADSYHSMIFYNNGDFMMRDPQRFDFPPIP